MTIWHKIKEILEQGSSLYLLTVVESNGSAPGRRGFKMIVSDSGYLYGSIGGGIMEFNMVEKAKSLLNESRIQHQIIKQVHRGQSESSSGMICSGSQIIAFNFLSGDDLGIIVSCAQTSMMIELSPNGINSIVLACEESFSMQDPDEWSYKEHINKDPVNKVHIFGAGHVSVALCELLSKFEFDVRLYDNRPELNTFVDNEFIQHKYIVSYENIKQSVSFNENDYVLLMTHKFIEDKLLLSQLMNNDFSYLGVLGSKNKINVMYSQLLKEGCARNDLERIYAPIGLSINSKTTEEIAVSIVAELIKIKNRN